MWLGRIDTATNGDTRGGKRAYVNYMYTLDFILTS